MNATQWPKQSKLIIIVWCLTAILILGNSSYRFISPTARDGRSIFRHLSAKDIQFISIEPAGYGSLVSRPVVIRDRQSIAALANALTNLPTHWPSHPIVTREVVLRIQLQDKVIGGVLSESSNDGITFCYFSDVKDGWVYATYLVPRDRAIFEIIEKALSP